MKNIVIDGVEYQLVPVGVGEVKDVLDDYSIESPVRAEEPVATTPINNGVKVAEPKVYDYRERYKQGKIYLTDVVAPTKILHNLPKLDTELDKFEYKGEKLFFGDGLEQEL